MAAADAISFKDLCIDAVNPEVLATFWASALGLRTEPSNANFRLRVTSNSSGSFSDQRDFFLDWVAVRVTFRP